MLSDELDSLKTSILFVKEALHKDEKDAEVTKLSQQAKDAQQAKDELDRQTPKKEKNETEAQKAEDDDDDDDDDKSLEEKMKAFLQTEDKHLRDPLSTFSLCASCLLEPSKSQVRSEAANYRRAVVGELFAPEFGAPKNELVEMFKANDVLCKPISLGNTMFHFDVKLSGESISNPSTRIATLNEAHYKRLAESVMKARHGDAATAGLRGNEIGVFLDGCKAKTGQNLLRPFVKQMDLVLLPGSKHGAKDIVEAAVSDDDDSADDGTAKRDSGKHKKRKVTIAKDEKSVLKRRPCSKSRGPGDLQVEGMHIVAQTFKGAPSVPCQVYPGQSSTGRFLGFVHLTPYENDFKLSVKEKKQVYGKHRMPVGRQQSDNAAAQKRAESQAELVFWHAFPESFYKAVCGRYNVGVVIDLTAGNGDLAMWCLKNRIPYMGICLSEHHKKVLQDRLDDFCLRPMSITGGGGQYSPKCAASLQPVISAVESEYASATTSTVPAAAETAKAEDDAKVKAEIKKKAETKKKADPKVKAETKKKADTKKKAKAKKSDSSKSGDSGSGSSDSVSKKSIKEKDVEDEWEFSDDD